MTTRSRSLVSGIVVVAALVAGYLVGSVEKRDETERAPNADRSSILVKEETPKAAPTPSSVPPPGTRIWGTIVNVNGDKIHGADVYLGAPSAWEYSRSFLTARGLLATTGEDGRYSMSPDSAQELSDLELNVRADGYTPKCFAAGTWQSEDAVIILSRGSCLKGRVVDVDGSGVDGATVTARPPQARRRSLEESVPGGASARIFEVHTDSHGGFEIWGVDPTRVYTLSAAKPGFMATPLPTDKRPSRIEGGQYAYKAGDSPIELKMAAVYVALVTVQFHGADYTGVARPLFASQNLMWPEGVRPIPVHTTKGANMPSEVVAAHERAQREFGRVVVLMGTATGRLVRAGRQPIVTLRNARVGKFWLEEGIEIELHRADRPLAAAVLGLNSDLDAGIATLRLRREDGKTWPRAKLPVAVETEDGALLSLVAVANDNRLELQTPVVPAGRSRVWVIDGWKPERGAPITVDLAPRSNPLYSIEYDAPPSPVTVVARDADGKPLGRMDLAVIVDGERAFRRYRQDSSGNGTEKVPRESFALAAEASSALLLIRPEGAAWQKIVLDQDKVADALRTFRLEIQLSIRLR